MKKKVLAILLTAAVLAVSGCTENGAVGNENAETVTEQVAATVKEKPEPIIYEFDNGDTAYFYYDDEPVPGCCG